MTDSIATFGTFQRGGGSVLTDPAWDQQTGQGQDDFVGDGTGGYYGFYYKSGTIGGVPSLVFRFRFNLYDASSGFTGNARMGVDGNGDGSIDLYFGVSTGQGQVPEIVFQNPDPGKLNVSPNTSGLTNVYGTLATTAANYSYMAVTDGSMYATKKGANANTDAFLTFAIPFSTFKANLESQLPGLTITSASYLRWVAFTSTQANAVNQDVYGMADLKNYGTTRYDDPYAGGFTDFYNTDGNKKVIPEPMTYLQIGVLLSAGLLVRLTRRNKK